MVRVRLPEALRGQFDSMDFVQAVWQSFFKIFKTNPQRFCDSDELRRYLAGMARNKVFEEHRRHTRTRKYDLGRQEPLTIRRGDREVPRDVVAPGPTPAEQAQARDSLDHLTAGRDPQESTMIQMRLDGMTFEEIAQRLGLHERTIRRVIESIRERMEGRE